jgi:hypothetical protein
MTQLCVEGRVAFEWSAAKTISQRIPRFLVSRYFRKRYSVKQPSWRMPRL